MTISYKELAVGICLLHPDLMILFSYAALFIIAQETKFKRMNKTINTAKQIVGDTPSSPLHRKRIVKEGKYCGLIAVHYSRQFELCDKTV